MDTFYKLLEIYAYVFCVFPFALVLIYRLIKKDKKEENDNKENNPKIKWYPTGWVFNEETKLWDPPDYIHKEAAEKWRWDEEKQIWVDKEKEERLKKYYEYRKSQGLPPTYEEWKAAKLKEQHTEEHPEE